MKCVEASVPAQCNVSSNILLRSMCGWFPILIATSLILYGSRSRWKKKRKEKALLGDPYRAHRWAPCSPKPCTKKILSMVAKVRPPGRSHSIHTSGWKEFDQDWNNGRINWSVRLVQDEIGSLIDTSQDSVQINGRKPNEGPSQGQTSLESTFVLSRNF